MVRLAESLAQLRKEIDAYAPNRKKTSDGWIGDPDHASRPSRHNPNNAGVVCALDITDDPAGGCPIHEIARRLVAKPHPNLDYVISNGQKASRKNGFRWLPYGGDNPHDKHAHFGVGVGPDGEPRPPYDDTTPWGVALAPQPPAQEDFIAMAAFDRLDALKGTVRGGLRSMLLRYKPDDREIDVHVLYLAKHGYDAWVRMVTESDEGKSVLNRERVAAGLHRAGG